MKIFYIFIALMVTLSNSNAILHNEQMVNNKPIINRFFPDAFGIPDAPDIMNKPIYDIEGNLRNKKLFNTSLGFIYQMSSFNMDVLNSYNKNNKSVGLNGEFILNLTGKIWFKTYAEGLWDSGTVLVSTSEISLSSQSISNSNYEIQAVIGYDILSYDLMDWSFYTGLFHKGILSNTNYTGTKVGSRQPLFLDQNLIANYTGAVLGTGLTFYQSNIVTNIYFEGYLTGTYGSFNKTTSNGSLPFSNYTGGGITGGFGVGAATKIEMVKNLWLKPFIKYQMLFSNQISSGGITTISSLNFQALTIGLGLSWR